MTAKDRSSEGLKIAFEHKGNAFYEFEQLDNAPAVRIESFLSRSHEINDLGMKRSDLKAFCKTIKEYGNEGRFMDVQQLNGYFEYLLDQPHNAMPTVYVVSSLLLINDEPVDKMQAEFDYQKQELAKSDEELLTFFFRILDKYDKASQTSSDSGLLLDFMKELPTRHQRQVEQIFLKSITQ
jgi:hypothetical protein